MHFTTFSTQALLASTALAAWPALLQPAINAGRDLVARQASSSTFQLSLSLTQGNTASTVSTDSASTTQSGATSQASGSTQSGSDRATTGSGIVTGSATTTQGLPNSSGTSFDVRFGPGGISMITPNPVSQSTYYKINDVITWGWNYTSLSKYPSAIDILAVGASNSVTYTLAVNQSVTATTGAFTWDSGAYQSSAMASSTPLAMESYTLIVHDAAKDVAATAAAGYLGTSNQFRFVMYQPSPYTTWDQWKCVTCSAASAMEKRTIGFVLGMAAVTVISFTWFAGVAGMF